MNVSLLGPRGTFSTLALEKYQKMVNDELIPSYYHTFDEVVSSLEDGNMGLIPLENTLDGYVASNLDLLKENDVEIVKLLTLPIGFNFLYQGNLDDIKQIYVQFKAMGQCKKFLKQFKNIKIINTESNMTSYEAFKENPAFSGAIVPNHIQDDTYASILSIEDEKENYTRFIVIKKRTKPFTLVSLNQEKIHLLLCIIPQNDYPGLLYEILKHFALYQVNLSSIISRPTKKKMGTYNFFVEIGIETEKIQMLNQCLDEIKNNVEMMIFGEY